MEWFTNWKNQVQTAHEETPNKFYNNNICKMKEKKYQYLEFDPKGVKLGKTIGKNIHCIEKGE